MFSQTTEAASPPVVELSFPDQDNVFASPWKKSDVVLIVEDTKFHVHRSILTMQSPVFEAMLNGHFKEVSQEKITLEGKTSEDMLQFLKLFYPPNMIKKPLISLEDEGVLKMLALADEYQAEDVMNQCLEETKVTAENAFKIRPYALKCNESVCEQCDEVIKRNIETCEIEKELPDMDRELAEKLLVAKCYFLESIAVRAYNLLMIFLKNSLSDESSSDSRGYSKSNSDNCCNHQVSLNDLKKARKCERCLFAFRKNFFDKALPKERQENRTKFFETLKECDEVATACQRQQQQQQSRRPYSSTVISVIGRWYPVA